MRRTFAAVLACALVAGCDSWVGEEEGPPLPGKRISVLVHEREVQPDAALADRAVVLPPPEANADWPQAGGLAHHAMHHLELADQLTKAWQTSIGNGRSRRASLLSQPVVADGKIFGLDSEARVTAVDARGGERLWEADLTPEHEDEGNLGGGLAFEDGRVFATTGYAEVVALDGKDGTILWRRQVSAPVRGAPVVRGGRVIATSVDNRTHALAADDGRVLWTHAGLSEIAGILGGSTPAIDGNVVVVPYSSGELFALRIENGAPLWSESLASMRRTDSMSKLTDIRGLPVVDRGVVYAAGNSDLVTAIDLRTGRRIWDRDIGSTQTPWLAGDFLYVLSNDNELLALEARTGRVKWVTPLQKWEDEDDRIGHVVWSGPVLASDRLVVASSHGWALSISPYTGQVLGKEEMPDGVTLSPVIADRTLYFLTDEADLIAYR